MQHLFPTRSECLLWKQSKLSNDQGFYDLNAFMFEENYLWSTCTKKKELRLLNTLLHEIWWDCVIHEQMQRQVNGGSCGPGEGESGCHGRSLRVRPVDWPGLLLDFVRLLCVTWFWLQRFCLVFTLSISSCKLACGYMQTDECFSYFSGVLPARAMWWYIITCGQVISGNRQVDR